MNPGRFSTTRRRRRRGRARTWCPPSAGSSRSYRRRWRPARSRSPSPPRCPTARRTSGVAAEPAGTRDRTRDRAVEVLPAAGVQRWPGRSRSGTAPQVVAAVVPLGGLLSEVHSTGSGASVFEPANVSPPSSWLGREVAARSVAEPHVVRAVRRGTRACRTPGWSSQLIRAFRLSTANGPFDDQDGVGRCRLSSAIAADQSWMVCMRGLRSSRGPPARRPAPRVRWPCCGAGPP